MTSNKRRICCFCETWESGGIESFLYNVLCRMDLTGLEIDLVAAKIGESIFTDGLAQRGVRFYELSGNPRHLLRNWTTFWQLLQKRKYDVIHFNVFQGLSLSYVQLAKEAGVPVRIVHCHGPALRPSKTRWLKMRIHLSARTLFANAATEHWACSSAAAKFMFPDWILQKDGFAYIHNGIDTARFQFCMEQRKELRRALAISRDFVIGHVGRLCEEKNQMFLLDIFANVLQRRPDSILLLAGGGSMEPRLRQKAKELNVEARVKFLGVTDKIPQLLWAMDAFVFPSLFEGLGIAAVEAQAAGLPVFCSKQVPDEARVISRFYKLSLKDSVSQWAEMILTHSLSDMDREKGAEQVRWAGFEIDDVARTIESAYRGQMR